MKHRAVNSEDMRCWAVATCRTRLELPLAEKLSERGYEAYTPRICAASGDRGAFPGYLFVETRTLLPAVAVAARWRTGFRILLSGGEFARVSSDLVQSIRTDEAAGMFEEAFHIRNAQHTIGQWVRVITSACQGFEGFVTRAKRHHTWIDNPGSPDFPHGAIRFPNSILQAIENPV